MEASVNKIGGGSWTGKGERERGRGKEGEGEREAHASRWYLEERGETIIPNP